MVRRSTEVIIVALLMGTGLAVRQRLPDGFTVLTEAEASSAQIIGNGNQHWFEVAPGDEVPNQTTSLHPMWVLATMGSTCSATCNELKSECMEDQWPESKSDFLDIIRKMGHHCAKIAEGSDSSNPMLQEGTCYWKGKGARCAGKSSHQRFCPCKGSQPVMPPKSQGGTCKPQCTWHCTEPRCDEVCEPKCEAPRCRTVCQRPDTTGCNVTCDEPTCWTQCPPANATCAGAECPKCEAKCRDGPCRVHCDKALNCTQDCEHPVCSWHCRAPTACPKPECKMICEAPKDPCPECTFHDELPSVLPGNSIVFWDKHYETTTTSRPDHVSGETGFDWSVDMGDTSRGSVAVLGDISGSMSSKNRMKVLRDNFKQLAAKADSSAREAILGAWNGLVTFCDKSCSTQQWIEGLKANGGNNMRFAIEQTIARYPEVTDVHVMGDGDVSPFAIPGKEDVDVTKNVPTPPSAKTESKDLSYHDTDWESFRARFAKVRMHFIAFGSDADVAMMRKMATLGNGTFLKVDDL